MIRKTSLISAVLLTLILFAASNSIFSSAQAGSTALSWNAPNKLGVNGSNSLSWDPPSKLGVNAKFFDDRISPTSSAVFWYGQLDATRNHTDVRIGYSPNEIQLYLNVFDKWLFYDESANLNDFENWDSVSVYIRPAGSNTSYKFQSQLHHWQSADGYRVASKNTGGGYVQDGSISFDSSVVWYGTAPNTDATDDRGWYTKLNIPYSSLGVGQPANGDVWEMALVTHDRDNTAGSTINSQTWPPSVDLNNPDTWGELRFGRRTQSPQTGTPSGTVSLRHGVNGAIVPDTHVGGGANCGVDHDPDFFNGWSTHNFPNVTQINIQNQMNVEDWPCFSKYFVSFDLGAIPAGQTIISAELKMYMFGNAGPPGEAGGSTLQVVTLDQGWNESSANWQNSPSVIEQIAETWVDPINNTNNFADPAIEVSWDVATAVDAAHLAGETLNLGIYAADWDLHSGKYFYSSDAPDDYHRPILTITYGTADPSSTPVPTQTPTPVPTATPIVPFVPTDFIYLPMVTR